MISSEYAIIGAGFAGAATAYHLTHRGVRDVLIIEQEPLAGVHSSGRNAAMVRQCVSDPALGVLARDGAAFLRCPPSDWPEAVLYKPNGSLLLGSEEGWVNLARDAETGRQLGVAVEIWPPEKAQERVPVLKGADFTGAVWCATDGVVDIHALLSGYLNAAISRGARVRYRSTVREIRSQPGGPMEVDTHDETIRTGAVVNAAGAWANTIAKMAGATEAPLHPCRRHLYVTPPLVWVDPTWPFVWDITHEFYFRPEAGGLLLCACDQEEMVPGDPPVDDSMREVLAEKVRRFFPGLSDVAVKRSWAGFRTLCADGRFVIGWDPGVERFFWVAGLGGHGVTTSAAVGALAADLLIAGEQNKAAEFSPARFLA